MSYWRDEQERQEIADEIKKKMATMSEKERIAYAKKMIKECRDFQKRWFAKVDEIIENIKRS